MSKPSPTTKEQLIYFLHNNINLGTYDKRFIENLVTNYLSALRPLTSNQSDLLDKVTLRYERQLRKLEVDANAMVQLSWNLQPIESSPKYTEVHVALNDDTIEIRSPFKSEFIKELKDFPYAKWNKDDRVWTIPASEIAIKTALDLIKLHYEKINYCPNIKDLLSKIEPFADAKFWNPTLVTVNNNYFIVCANEALMKAVSDIPLNSSLASIAILKFHGVEISESVINSMTEHPDEISFAVERELTIEYDIDLITERLQSIGADYVLMREWNIIDKNLSKNLKLSLDSKNIKTEILDKGLKPSVSEIKQSKLPVLISGISFSTPIITLFAKTINIVNNSPIDIK